MKSLPYWLSCYDCVAKTKLRQTTLGQNAVGQNVVEQSEVGQNALKQSYYVCTATPFPPTHLDLQV
jgi:hypothetical protein